MMRSYHQSAIGLASDLPATAGAPGRASWREAAVRGPACSSDDASAIGDCLATRMQQQVTQLFSRFPTASVTKAAINRALTQHDGSCQLIQVLNGEVLVQLDRDGFQERLSQNHFNGRIKDLVCLLRMAAQRRLLTENVELFACASDHAELVMGDRAGSRLPVLTANFDGAEESGIPVPMPSRGASAVLCPRVAPVGHSGRSSDPSSSVSPPSWGQKRSVAFFRGSAHPLLRHDPRYCRDAKRGWERTPCVRKKLVSELRTFRGFDVSVGSYVPEVEWERNKYLLVIGNARGWADRLGASLRKSSVSILVDGGVGEWFYPLLEEGTHYLRANASVASVVEVVRWAQAHDTAVRRLPQASSRLMNEIFTTDTLVRYVALVATAYHRTLSYSPQRRVGWGIPSENPSGLNCSKMRVVNRRRWCESLHEAWEGGRSIGSTPAGGMRESVASESGAFHIQKRRIPGSTSATPTSATPTSATPMPSRNRKAGAGDLAPHHLATAISRLTAANAHRRAAGDDAAWRKRGVSLPRSNASRAAQSCDAISRCAAIRVLHRRRACVAEASCSDECAPFFSRPRVPVGTLNAEQLLHCEATVNLHGWARGARVVLVAHMTDRPSLWHLGRSAAALGVPLLVSGLGRRWCGMFDKPRAYHRVLQVLERLAFVELAIFVDATDTLVLSPPVMLPELPVVARLRKAQAAGFWPLSANTVLISAECNLFPARNCSAQLREYNDDLDHAACRASSSACFANSGGIAGSPRALTRFVNAWLEGTLPRAQEDDQKVLHQVYLQRARLNLDIRIDSRSAIFLSLRTCNRTGSDCMHPGEEPARDVLNHLSVMRKGVRYLDPRDGLESTPWIAHSNGHGKAARMAQLIDMVESSNRSAATDKPGQPPLLLIDAAVTDGCHIQ